MSENKKDLYKKLPKWVRAKRKIHKSIIRGLHSVMLNAEKTLALIDILDLPSYDKNKIKKAIKSDKSIFQFHSEDFEISKVRSETQDEYEERLDAELKRFEKSSILRNKMKEEIEKEEIRLLAKLKAKYEANKAPGENAI